VFTGIIVERGCLIEDPAPSGQGGVRLVIGHSEEVGRRLEIGASLSVSGVCLTITELKGTRSTVELSPETLSRTTLGGLRRGDPVNLEPALRMGDALGGHWVQGHVDGTGVVLARSPGDRFDLVRFGLPVDLARYVAEKGSVAVDGVSLTVIAVGDDWFEVGLIPQTLGATTLGRKAAGDPVNLEVDVLAKYTERLLAAGRNRS